jgi:hypothetical protein
MKAEKSNEQPAFNLFKPEGQRDMQDAKVITKVWLTNGMEYDVIPGTFHFFTTKGDRPQPFVQFQAQLGVMVGGDYKSAQHTVEVFPASVAGVGYLTEDANE